MAAGNHRKRLIVVMEDQKPDYFVHSINITHLFKPAPSRAGPMEIRSLPRPMGQIPKPLAHPECIDFALAGDGATLVGVSNLKRTVLYDTRSGASSTGPELQHGKTGGVYVLPLGRRLYALKCRLNGSDEGKPAGEDVALFPSDGGARLRLACSASSWGILPEPPPDYRYLNDSQLKCQLTAHFAAGARVWVSAEGRGTYSFHTVRRAWRKEGDWELPFYHRAVFVPELDNLCFGLCAKDRCLLAVDVKRSPPVVRYRWEDTFPRWARENGYRCGIMPEGSLVYLGGGRFCIAWTVLVDNADGDGHRQHFIHLMALQIIKTTSAISGKNQEALADAQAQGLLPQNAKPWPDGACFLANSTSPPLLVQ